jgi:hypothetical protein
LGSWFKYKIEEIGQIDSKDVFSQAESLAESVDKGKVKASEPVDVDQHVADESEDNEEAPF